MEIVDTLFNKQENTTEKSKEVSIDLAFVLLSDAQLPAAKAIALAFHDFAAEGEVLQEKKDDTVDDQITTISLNTREKSFIALIPTAVPNDEADQMAQYSLSHFSNDWVLPPHNAHLMVTFHTTPDSSPIVRLSRFTSILAAIMKVSPSVGVYWANTGATHDSEFFVSIATDQSIVSRMILWSGVSIAREDDGRLSLLSLGMEQLNLQNLLLIAREDSFSVAIETMYDLLSYVAELGEPLPEGHTVGRSENERLPVHYVKSPIDSKNNVWRVELP